MPIFEDLLQLSDDTIDFGGNVSGTLARPEKAILQDKPARDLFGRMNIETDATGRMIRQEERTTPRLSVEARALPVPKQKPVQNCEVEKQAVERVKLMLSQKKDELEFTKVKNAELKSSLGLLEHDLYAMKRSKTPTDIALTGIGIIGGGLGGGLIGARLGPVGIIPGMLLGSQRGDKMADKAKGVVADQVLLMEQEVKVVQAKIRQLKDKIESLNNEIISTRQVMAETKKALKICRHKN